MALDEDDEARLRRIETDLAGADPDLAGKLERMTPGAAAPAWSAVPGWTAVVFACAFVAWVAGPVVGGVVLVVGVCGLALRRAARRPGGEEPSGGL